LYEENELKSDMPRTKDGTVQLLKRHRFDKGEMEISSYLLGRKILFIPSLKPEHSE
jgi:hypothetical protein